MVLINNIIHVIGYTMLKCVVDGINKLGTWVVEANFGYIKYLVQIMAFSSCVVGSSATNC
uniref:Uncharacterized protein n=1 Tax=Rhizophora mucronata TaxID=61149 RepID=A0A2P2Q5T4_RHIMU